MRRLGSISDEIELTSKFKRKRVFIIVVKYLAPVFLGVIVLSNILQILGVVNI